MLSQNRKCKSSITFTNTISIILVLQTVIVSPDFNELFEADWAPDHIVAQGDRISLSLDSSTGCGFESKKKYLFGKASDELKLVQGDSAGTRICKQGEKGKPYPRKQAMGIYGSLWNADDWATQGGRVKTNWTNAPFVVTFNSLEIDACAFLSDKADDVDAVAKCGKSGQFWWINGGEGGAQEKEKTAQVGS
ncbi:hypothetical protein SASPL_157123 [Salvia splendens]|uniref:GH16 domain-containing protein n=1 Tax=Salvia splendens TaxID=180675 RepID=A0A8X8VVI5_SALSN|nr:hypothetical protein SASPL_157123 [Salvia splendens]